MLRLCTRGHVTGTKTCWCDKPAINAPIAGRLRPVPLHPKSKGAIRLRAIRAEHRVGPGGKSTLKKANSGF